MSPVTAPYTPLEALSKSRGWLIATGVLSVVVGLLALSAPLLFSFVIVQVLGIFILVSGVISLFLALFEKHTTHRVLNAVFALIRIAAGSVLLVCVASSLGVITLIFAAFLIVEGVFAIGGAFKMRQHDGWIWVLLNGVAALVLGLLLVSSWPADSLWVLGLFYGINSLFAGMSLLMLGFGTRKTTT